MTKMFKKNPSILAICGALIVTGIFLITVGISTNLNQLVDTTTLSLPTPQSSKLPKVFVIESGSMEPAIKTASLIITLPHKYYKIGDIITFSTGKNTTTHRVGELAGTSPITEYKTFGDANEDYDTGLVKKDQILGKVILTLPYLGYVIDFAKKPQGFILFIIIPATIIIYEELKSLKQEIFKTTTPFWTKFRNQNHTPLPSSNPTHHGLPKFTLIIPILGSIAIFIGFTGSYLFDIETISENSLSMFTPAPTLISPQISSPIQNLASLPTTPSATPTILEAVAPATTASDSATATNSATPIP